ncbi:IS1004 transposase [Beggiatoa sp. PS]|nr:IS1004 transposase [Beggiatoa sp. PS]
MRENVILRTVQIGDEVNRCIHHFTQSLKCEVVELHVQVENKHLIVMIPPKISISDFVDTVKGRTAIQIFNQFRYLKTRHYWGNHFWEKGYCVDIIGLDTDKIRRYVVFQERLERQPDGHANFFIGGAGDNANLGSPIYRARVSLLYVTNNNKILAYNKTFKWGEATRNGGILKQILMFPINLSKAIFGIKSHSDAFKHIKNLRDTGKIPLDKAIRLYGHSWGGSC